MHYLVLFEFHFDTDRLFGTMYFNREIILNWVERANDVESNQPANKSTEADRNLCQRFEEIFWKLWWSEFFSHGDFLALVRCHKSRSEAVATKKRQQSFLLPQGDGSYLMALILALVAKTTTFGEINFGFCFSRTQAIYFFQSLSE